MRNIIFVSIVFLLCACQQTPLPIKPGLNLGESVYNINVARINLSEEYDTSDKAPHVEKLADVTPAEAVKQWAAKRLVAVGQKDTMEVAIIEASIVKNELGKQKKGIEGFFTKEQTEEYVGKLEVELKIYNESKPLPIARVHASANNSHTIREDATLADRNALYHQITLDLIHSLEGELDKNIRQYFANYLNY